MKHFQSITALFLAAALTLGLCLPVFAADEGLPGIPAGEIQTTDESQIWLSDSMYYDTKERDFIYPLGETGLFLHSNVADGMITASPVYVRNGMIIAYKDGQLMDHNSNEPLEVEEPGEYVIMSQVGGQTIRLFSFTLTGPTSSVIFGYNLPDGMYVTRAELNGEEIGYDRYYVPMQQDGLYHIEYECMSTYLSNLVYSLDVTVDREPPELEFSGSIDEKHRVHSALHISGIEEGGSIRVTLDGSPLDVAVNRDGTAELPDSGNYVIEAFDAAGNRSEYVYTVLIYLNSGGLVFLAILIASILAVAIYILIKRKKLKIG